MDTFGTKLRAARLKAGMTQNALAEAVGLTHMMISRYENDRVEAPDADIIADLVGALGLGSAEDLGFAPKGGKLRALHVAPTKPLTPREWALNPKAWPRHLFELHGFTEPEQIAALAEELAGEAHGVENVDVQLARIWLSARQKDVEREAKKKAEQRRSK